MYLSNHKFFLIDTSDILLTENWKLVEMTQTTKGNLMKTITHSQKYSMTYFLTKKEDNSVDLYGFARETLFILNTLVQELKGKFKVIDHF